VLAHPRGHACHKGTRTCWGVDAPQAAIAPLAFLSRLEQVIRERIATRPDGSYTAKLLAQGLRRIAQKVGEEGLELALAAVAQSDAEIVGEAADLLYHTVLLLQVKGLALADIIRELELRHAARESRAPSIAPGREWQLVALSIVSRLILRSFEIRQH